jgi:hypothetical protein
VEGFSWREEMKWRRTYRLWSVNLKDPASVTFDRFMGREPVLTEREKFDQLWELLEEDRKKGTDANCTAS